jgi:hypothetical protein
MQPRHVPNAELDLRDGPVVRDGGELRVLTGENYGLHQNPRAVTEFEDGSRRD